MHLTSRSRHARAATSPALVPPVGWRARRVIAELDARGEIDGHAAMCLATAIDAALRNGAGIVLVDLRELSSIGPGGLALLCAQHDGCAAQGVELQLWISSGERHDRVARSFLLAGLGDALRYSFDAGPPAPAAPAPVHVAAARAQRVARAARRRIAAARPRARR